MGWFDGHDVDKISDDPNKLPDNTYKFKVIAAEHGPSRNDPTRMQLSFKYQIIEGPWASFYPISDWAQTPENVDPAIVERLLSHIKVRFRAFGYSDEEIAKLDPKKLKNCINRVFYGTTRFTERPDGSTGIRITQYSPIDGNRSGLDEFFSGGSDGNKVDGI